MPGRNGYEVAQLRQEPAAARAHPGAAADGRVRADRSGEGGPRPACDGVLAKPFEPQHRHQPRQGAAARRAGLSRPMSAAGGGRGSERASGKRRRVLQPARRGFAELSGGAPTDPPARRSTTRSHRRRLPTCRVCRQPETSRRGRGSRCWRCRRWPTRSRLCSRRERRGRSRARPRSRTNWSSASPARARRLSDRVVRETVADSSRRRRTARARRDRANQECDRSNWQLGELVRVGEFDSPIHRDSSRTAPIAPTPVIRSPDVPLVDSADEPRPGSPAPA